MKYICILSFIMILVIIEFLATATAGVESVTLGWDKLNHMAAFAVLYILVSLAFEDLSVVYRFLLLFVFGLQIEIAQSFLPPREFSSLDVVADMVGIMFGFLISPYAARFFRYK